MVPTTGRLSWLAASAVSGDGVVDRRNQFGKPDGLFQDFADAVPVQRLLVFNVLPKAGHHDDRKPWAEVFQFG